MTDQERVVQLAHAPGDPISEPFMPVIAPRVDTQDDDPDEIFLNAVAEIETQPLVKKTPRVMFRWQDVFQTLLCVSLIAGSGIGLVWQLINYPKTIVTIFPVTHVVTITAALDVPLRILAPITLTRTATASTTGHGHQDARPATGTLTFYNGQAMSVSIAAGTVFTTGRGEHIITDQAVTIPAAVATTAPTFGNANVVAHAVTAGVGGNIAAEAINGACCVISVFVKNLHPFSGGRDARDYRAVAQRDLDSLTTTTTQTVNQEIPQAFIVRTGEALHTTTCTTKTTADHALGDETRSITVKTVGTCAGVAYNQNRLQQRAIHVFTARTVPGKQYELYGSVHFTVISVTPFQVKLMGTWAYVLSQDYEQFLAVKIAGKTPDQARKFLLRTGVISQASVPGTLPQAMYIKFLVLMEK